jgi:hypothetical protein
MAMTRTERDIVKAAKKELDAIEGKDVISLQDGKAAIALRREIDDCKVKETLRMLHNGTGKFSFYADLLNTPHDEFTSFVNAASDADKEKALSMLTRAETAIALLKEKLAGGTGNANHNHRSY